MAGWRLPGQRSNAGAWAYDTAKGWLPPGMEGDEQGTQLEMGENWDPSRRDAGWHTIISPPGVAAPLDAINYTPQTNEAHAEGMQAPIQHENLSIMPASLPNAASGGYVGMGQSQTVGYGADELTTPDGRPLSHIGAADASNGYTDFYSDPQGNLWQRGQDDVLKPADGSEAAAGHPGGATPPTPPTAAPAPAAPPAAVPPTASPPAAQAPAPAQGDGTIVRPGQTIQLPGGTSWTAPPTGSMIYRRGADGQVHVIDPVSGQELGVQTSLGVIPPRVQGQLVPQPDGTYGWFDPITKTIKPVEGQRVTPQGTWSQPQLAQDGKTLIIYNSTTQEIKNAVTGEHLAGPQPASTALPGGDSEHGPRTTSNVPGSPGVPATYSPFDAIFRKYAGDLANNDEFISIVAAGTKAESGWDPKIKNSVGAAGLFQIHPIHNVPDETTLDPEKATILWLPQYIASYKKIKAEHPDWRGAQLAAAVAGDAERPEGYNDPNSVAWGNYTRAYGEVVQGAGGLPPTAGGTTTRGSGATGGGPSSSAAGVFTPGPDWDIHDTPTGTFAVNKKDPTQIVKLPIPTGLARNVVGTRLVGTDPTTNETTDLYKAPNMSVEQHGRYVLLVNHDTGETNVIQADPDIQTGPGGHGMMYGPDVNLNIQKYGKYGKERGVEHIEATQPVGYDMPEGTKWGPLTADQLAQFGPQKSSILPQEGPAPAISTIGQAPISLPSTGAQGGTAPMTGGHKPPPATVASGMDAAAQQQSGNSVFRQPLPEEWLPPNAPTTNEPVFRQPLPEEWLPPNAPIPGDDTRPTAPAAPQGGYWDEINGRWVPYTSHVITDDANKMLGGGQASVGWGQSAPDTSVGTPGGGYPWDPEAQGDGWQPPLDPSTVVGGGNKFGQQVSMEGTHQGTDLQAYEGTPVYSPVDGTVVAVDDDPQGLGIQVHIQGVDGTIHTVAHLLEPGVQQGDQVTAGQPVGKVGQSGAGATGPHLDYRVQDPQGNYINPELSLGGLAQMPPSPDTIGEDGQRLGQGQDGGVPDGWPPGFQLPSGADPWDRSAWTDADFAAYQAALRGAPMPQGLGFDQPYSDQSELPQDPSSASPPMSADTQFPQGQPMGAPSYEDKWTRPDMSAEHPDQGSMGDAWQTNLPRMSPEIQQLLAGLAAAGAGGVALGGQLGQRMGGGAAGLAGMLPRGLFDPSQMYGQEVGQGQNSGGRMVLPGSPEEEEYNQFREQFQSTYGPYDPPGYSPESVAPIVNPQPVRVAPVPTFVPGSQEEYEYLTRVGDGQAFVGSGQSATHHLLNDDGTVTEHHQDGSSLTWHPDTGEVRGHTPPHTRSAGGQIGVGSGQAVGYGADSWEPDDGGAWQDLWNRDPDTAQRFNDVWGEDQGWLRWEWEDAGKPGGDDGWNNVLSSGSTGSPEDPGGGSQPPPHNGGGGTQPPTQDPKNNKYRGPDGNNWPDFETYKLFTDTWGKFGIDRWDWENSGSPGGEAAWQRKITNWGGNPSQPGNGGPYTPQAPNPKPVDPGSNPGPPAPGTTPPTAPTQNLKLTEYETAYIRQQQEKIDIDKQHQQLLEQQEDNRHNEALRTAHSQEDVNAENVRHNQQMEQLNYYKTNSDAQQAELNRQNQLRQTGSFAQQQQAELLKSALNNPWVQNLTGMAPAFGAAGWNPDSPSTLSDLLKGWEPQANVLGSYQNPSPWGQQGGTNFPTPGTAPQDNVPAPVGAGTPTGGTPTGGGSPPAGTPAPPTSTGTPPPVGGGTPLPPVGGGTPPPPVGGETPPPAAPPPTAPPPAAPPPTAPPTGGGMTPPVPSPVAPNPIFQHPPGSGAPVQTNVPPPTGPAPVPTTMTPPGYQQVPNIYKNSTPEQIAQHAAIVKSNAALMRAWRASGGYAAAVAQRNAARVAAPRNPVAAPAASPFGATAPTTPPAGSNTSVGASPFGAAPTGASPFAPTPAPSSPFGAPSAPPVTTVQPVRQPTTAAKITPRRDAKAAANAAKKLTKMKDAVSV